MVLVAAVLAGCQTRKEVTPPTIEKLNKQISLNFRDSEAHYELGKIYQDKGDYQKATFEYNNALNFDPVNRDAQACMVKSYRLMGDDQQAAEKARIYLQQTSQLPEDSISLGRAFEHEGVSDYALAAYEQALKLAPKSAVPYKQLGYYYLGRKDQNMAVTYFKQSFELDPYQKDVAYELGKLGIRVKVQQAPPPAASPAKKKS
jgi:tetratricopeptide (TPR) repeat protein